MHNFYLLPLCSHSCYHCRYSTSGAAIRYNHYKLIIGKVGGSNVIQSWPKQGSSPVPFGRSGGTLEPGTDHCRAPLLEDALHVTADVTCDPYCLYHVIDDPTESKDLAKESGYANITSHLLALLKNATATAPPPAYIIPSAARDQLCADEAATGYLEPLDWHH